MLTSSPGTLAICPTHPGPGILYDPTPPLLPLHWRLLITKNTCVQCSVPGPYCQRSWFNRLGYSPKSGLFAKSQGVPQASGLSTTFWEALYSEMSVSFWHWWHILVAMSQFTEFFTLIKHLLFTEVPHKENIFSGIPPWPPSHWLRHWKYSIHCHDWLFITGLGSGYICLTSPGLKLLFPY